MKNKIIARHFWVSSLLTALLVLLAGMVSARRAQAEPTGATLIVNDLGDDDCGLLGCPPCDGSSPCTLRQAIKVSNTNGFTANKIRFDPSLTGADNYIFVGSGLPPITKEGTWLDGRTAADIAVNVIVSGQSTTDDIFTIDSVPGSTTNTGNNIILSRLYLAEAPGGSNALIRVKSGRRSRIFSNVIGSADTATQTCNPQIQRRNAIVVESTAGTADANNGSSYIYSNTIVCSVVGVSVNGAQYVHIGEDLRGTAAPNFVGVNSAGSPRANEKDGVYLQGKYNRVVNNTIFNNGQNGMRLECSFPSQPDIHDNFVGSNTIRGNGQDGILLEGTCQNGNVDQNDLVGNVIGKNNSSGIHLDGAGVHHNRINSNLIGTTRDGLEPDGNGTGLFVEKGAHQNTIGAGAATRNLISGNGGYGIYLADAGTTGNRIRGNYIGTNLPGTAAIPNGDDGIAIVGGATGNRVGGDDRDSHNLIAGNGDVGISLRDAETSANTIASNDIGYNLDNHTPLPNGAGIELANDTHDNSIGFIGDARAPNAVRSNAGIGIWVHLRANHNSIRNNDVSRNGTVGVMFDLLGTMSNIVTLNKIHHNGSAGIGVRYGAAGNIFANNKLYNNGGLGIDLDMDGATANDPGDGDVGSNDLQNYPVIRHAFSATRRIRGTLNSTPNSSFRIDFYASPVCDASGYGEGQKHLGWISVTTDASGNASFNELVPGGFSAGGAVTATAINGASSTSEFSRCRMAE